LGGTFGYQLNDWFKLTLGTFGSLILILAIGYLFALILFNFNLNKIISWFKRTKTSEEEEDSSEENKIISEDDIAVVNTIKEEEKIAEQVASTVDLSEKAENELISEVIDETAKEEPAVITQQVEPEQTPEKLEDSDDGEFSVKVATADADEELSNEEVNEKLEEFGEYDPKLDLSSYTLPPIDLLQKYDSKGPSVDKAELEANKNKIVETLSNYKIEISKIMAIVSPKLKTWKMTSH
jgi:S-DNA-T family DNA segregation ATPase FtsK/SpoIIIE